MPSVRSLVDRLAVRVLSTEGRARLVAAAVAGALREERLAEWVRRDVELHERLGFDPRFREVLIEALDDEGRHDEAAAFRRAVQEV